MMNPPGTQAISSTKRWLVNDDLERNGRGLIEVLLWSDWENHEYLRVARVPAENRARNLPKTRYLIWKASFVTSRCSVSAIVGRPTGRPQFVGQASWPELTNGIGRIK
jgi:hypothetical protein